MSNKGMEALLGKPAPLFCLPDEAGENRCLEDYKGKWVVVYFYPKDNTPGCTQEAKDFSCIAGDFEGMGVKVFGISADGQESHKMFMLKHELAISLLSDKDHQVLKEYGAFGEKKLYGKLTMGVTRSTFLVDPEGKVAHVWPKVSVKGHAEEVLARIRELKG
ncbi:MAG: peroxiredoxin [Candidatus Thermoplasmatota archaeon]|nr:peroxiredoxin [Candidatus Thermoplasmatota archaeon]